MSRNKGRESTINGVILPDKWDDHDNVVGVAIGTPDGEEYLVESNERANQLLAFVDDAVRATGVIRQRLDGSITISVKSFETFGPYNQGSEEDDDYDYLDDEGEDWK